MFVSTLTPVFLVSALALALVSAPLAVVAGMCALALAIELATGFASRPPGA